MTINDSALNLVPKKKDIICWRVKKNTLVMTVRKSVFDELLRLLNIKDSSGITKQIVESAILRHNHYNELRYLQKTLQYENELREWNLLSKEEKEIMSKPNKPIAPNIVKARYIDYDFNTIASRRAFIKAYFLYELLVWELGYKEGFSQEDFAQSLKYGREQVAVSNIQRIRKKLHREKMLYTNTKAHYASLPKKLGDKSPIKDFSYVFHPKEFHSYKQSDESIEIKYQLYGTVKEIIRSTDKFWTTVEHEMTEAELSKILSSVATYISLENLNNLLETSLLEIDLSDGVRVGDHITAPETKSERNPMNDFVKHVIKIVHEDENKLIRLNTEIYIPPYKDLSFVGLTNKDLIRYGNLGKLKFWLIHRKDKARITFSTRLFHPFHNLPKQYRKKLAYKGSPLIEVMDVHNCFYVLMLKAMQLSDQIDVSELNRYEILVRSGRLYDEVGNYVVFDRRNYPNDEYNINWSEEEYLWFRGLSKRDLIKEWMQSYRNFGSVGQARHNHSNIDDFYKYNFPTIREWLFSYPMTKNREGKTVKRLQHDMCVIETYLISNVCHRLVTHGVVPFSLHDGIYLSKEHIKQLQLKLGLVDEMKVTDYVSDLFWIEFDNLKPNQLEYLINITYDTFLPPSYKYVYHPY